MSVALAVAGAACCARRLCHSAPAAVRARRAAAAWRKEAVIAGRARCSKEGVVRRVLSAVRDAVPWDAGAVGERCGAWRRCVLVCWAGGARRVAVGGRKEGVRAQNAGIRKFVWRVRGPGQAAAAGRAEAVVDVCGAWKCKLACRAGRRVHGAGGAVVVCRTEHTRLLPLVCESAGAVGAGGAWQAEKGVRRGLVLQLLEAGGAHAALHSCLAYSEERA